MGRRGKGSARGWAPPRDHLVTRYNLAIDLAEDFDAEAVPLLERNVLDFERVLGRDDPLTLDGWARLADACYWAGDQVRATPLFEWVVAEYERVLGSDHAYTNSARVNLARVREAQGSGAD